MPVRKRKAPSRYGDSGLTSSDYHCSLDEVAQEMGLSRERVRQIEAIALEKMRKRLLAMGIGPTELDEDPGPGPHLFNVKRVL